MYEIRCTTSCAVQHMYIDISYTLYVWFGRNEWVNLFFFLRVSQNANIPNFSTAPADVDSFRKYEHK